MSAIAQQARVSRCWEACERNIDDARVRASACTACLTHPEDPAAWLVRAPTPSQRLLSDADWQVRWAGLEQDALTSHKTLSAVLTAWLTRLRDDELVRGCVTAVHGAGKSKQTLTALLGPQATLCEKHLPQILQALDTQLYDERTGVRLEALRHRARALGVPPARVILDAVPGHPAGFDGLVLDTLSEYASEEATSAPAQLLSTARESDVGVMNRLLAVLSARADAARASLAKAKDPMERKEAMVRLVALAPLSEADLLEGIVDADASVRRTAVRGLARGTGGSIVAATKAFLSGQRPSTLAQQRALLLFMSDASEPDCATTALELWRTPTLEPELHRLCLPVAASCSWDTARPEVERIFRDNSPPAEVAAAVAALASAPLGPQTMERLERALGHLEADVRARACDAVAYHRWRKATPRVTALTRDPVPAVRAAALVALAGLDAPSLEQALSHALDTDVDASVRSSAARLLGEFSGPRALAALTRAARNDTDANVKFVAAESLRKLGAGTPP